MVFCKRHPRYVTDPFCPDCRHEVEAVNRRIERLLHMPINYNPGSVARAIKEVAAILSELNARCLLASPTQHEPDRASGHNR